jgi:phosphate transporter
MMMLGLFLSMWISNHTAPVLCISVLSPIIADYGAECRFVRALLLGVGESVAARKCGKMHPFQILTLQQQRLPATSEGCSHP